MTIGTNTPGGVNTPKYPIDHRNSNGCGFDGTNFIVTTGNLIKLQTFEDARLLNGALATVKIGATSSITLSNNYGRKGKTSGRFEVNWNDGTTIDAPRAEIAQEYNTGTSEVWLGLSFLFPSSEVFDDREYVICQFHESADEQLGEQGRSPSWDLSVLNGHLKLFIRWAAAAVNSTGQGLTTVDGDIDIDLGPIVKEKWIDIVAHNIWGYSAGNGTTELWINGTKVVNRQNMPNWYNDVLYPYFRCGVYEWSYKERIPIPKNKNRILYIDQVRLGGVGSSYAEVDPTQ